MRKLFSEKGMGAPILLVLVVVGLLSYMVISSVGPFQNAILSQLNLKPSSQAAEEWAFEDTFDYGAPTAPSQTLLPKTFDFVSTNRTHPAHPDGLDANGSFGTFPADHDEDCSFDGTNAKQHDVTMTTHRSNSANPDQSFFLCNNHLMSSMGEVEGYSVTSFWPKQEFDFSSGGTLEYDVNLNLQSRNWYEVIITPREQFKVAPAMASLPISETYPKDRIVLRYGSPGNSQGRQLVVSNMVPIGWDDRDRNVAQEWNSWLDRYPNDPVMTDRRIRRKNKITITENQIVWGIQKVDGTFDDMTLAIPEGLPLHKGFVEFKTHAYTPNKDEVHRRHTFHWDNIRFSGPKMTPYESYEDNSVINLEGNGSAPIGSTKTVSIQLPRVGTNPIIMGQVHQGLSGQVQVSINGGPAKSVSPVAGLSEDGCTFGGDWSTFHFPVNASELKVGENTFKWTVGPRPGCAQGQWYWDGFAIKGLEVQMDAMGGPSSTPSSTATAAPTAIPTTAPTATPVPTPVPTIVPTATATPRPTATPTIAPTPSPTPVAVTFQTSASFNQVEAFAGSKVRLTSKVRSSARTTALINIEIYNEQGIKVGQNYYDNQSFSANQEKSYGFDWVLPQSGSGKYTVKIGVYGKGWSGLVSWNDNAGSISTPKNEGTFRGEYFNNRTLSGDPSFVRDDQIISFNWGVGAPAAVIRNEEFSVRWTKTVNFEGGNYQFSERGDDGVRIFIDNQRVYNRWSDQAARTRTFNRSIPAGNHTIRVEYYENRGNAEIMFNWRKL